jgi:hypothetical protein
MGDCSVMTTKRNKTDAFASAYNCGSAQQRVDGPFRGHVLEQLTGPSLFGDLYWFLLTGYGNSHSDLHRSVQNSMFMIRMSLRDLKLIKELRLVYMVIYYDFIHVSTSFGHHEVYLNKKIYIRRRIITNVKFLG